jgi:hypothetical protein
MLPTRLRQKIEVTDSCWIWRGHVKANGYGAAGQGHQAHRRVYELLVGPISDGLQLDHLCRVLACVNPAHLEPVTPRENGRRGNSPWGINARKTHCVHGHEFTPENTYVTRRGQRHCRECSRRRDRKAYWRHREDEQDGGAS